MMFIFQVAVQQGARKSVQEISQHAVLLDQKMAAQPQTIWSVKGLVPDAERAKKNEQKATAIMQDLGKLSSDWQQKGMSENEFKLFHSIFAMMNVRGEKYTANFFEGIREAATVEDALLKIYDASAKKSELVQKDASIGEKSGSKNWWTGRLAETVGEVKISEQKQPEGSNEAPQAESSLSLDGKAFGKVAWINAIAKDGGKNAQFFEALKTILGYDDWQAQKFADAAAVAFTDKSPVSSDESKPAVPLSLALAESANSWQDKTPLGLAGFLVTGTYAQTNIGMSEAQRPEGALSVREKIEEKIPQSERVSSDNIASE